MTVYWFIEGLSGNRHRNATLLWLYLVVTRFIRQNIKIKWKFLAFLNERSALSVLDRPKLQEKLRTHLDPVLDIPLLIVHQQVRVLRAHLLQHAILPYPHVFFVIFCCCETMWLLWHVWTNVSMPSTLYTFYHVTKRRQSECVRSLLVG